MTLRFICFVLAGLIVAAPSLAAGSTNWPPAGYTEIRAYLYNLDGVEGAPIFENGKLSRSVVSSNGVVLGKRERERLLHAVTGSHRSYGIAKCYDPRHAFVFYDAAQKPVGFIEICFECAQYQTSARRTLGALDLVALRRLFQELELPVFDNSKDYLALKKKPQAAR